MRAKNQRISLGFADDIISSGRGKENLNEAINLYENWAKYNKMTINRDKSGVMIIMNNNKVETN